MDESTDFHPRARELVEPVKMGRPSTGKKSSGQHTQITALLRVETSENLDEELMHINRVRRRKKETLIDRSDVIEELLTAWIAAQRAERMKG